MVCDNLCLFSNDHCQSHCFINTDLLSGDFSSSSTFLQVDLLIFSLDSHYSRLVTDIFLHVFKTFIWQPLFYLSFSDLLLGDFSSPKISFFPLFLFLFTGCRSPQQDIALVSWVHKFSTNLRCQNELFLFFLVSIRLSFSSFSSFNHNQLFSFFLLIIKCSFPFSLSQSERVFPFFPRLNQIELFIFSLIQSEFFSFLLFLIRMHFSFFFVSIRVFLSSSSQSE